MDGALRFDGSSGTLSDSALTRQMRRLARCLSWASRVPASQDWSAAYYAPGEFTEAQSGREGAQLESPPPTPLPAATGTRPPPTARPRPPTWRRLGEFNTTNYSLFAYSCGWPGT